MQKNIDSQPLVLLFGVNVFKVNKIMNVCTKLGIKLKCVDKSDYAQKLGAIAQIKGFGKENTSYTGTGFAGEMMVFSGIDSKLLDKFLECYKEEGIEPVACKAVITADNIFWTPEKLFFELMCEHRRFLYI